MTQDIAGRSVRFTSVLNLKMLWNHHLTNCKQTAENRRISDERDKLTHLFHYVCREDSGGEGSTEDVRKLLVKAADTHLLKVPVWADDGLARLSGLSFPWRRVGQKKTVNMLHSYTQQELSGILKWLFAMKLIWCQQFLSFTRFYFWLMCSISDHNVHIIRVYHSQTLF